MILLKQKSSNSILLVNKTIGTQNEGHVNKSRYKHDTNEFHLSLA